MLFDQQRQAAEKAGSNRRGVPRSKLTTEARRSQSKSLGVLGASVVSFPNYDGRDLSRSIVTFTGRRFWPLDPRACDLCIEDIAHALSLKCRFTGHTRSFYSVAEHSVRVAQIVAPPHRLWALLHDAGEAYLPDVAGPIKDLFPLLVSAEEAILNQVIQHFGLDRRKPPEVKQADKILLATEIRDLIQPHHFPALGEMPLTDKIIPLPADHAEQAFRRLFTQLTKARGSHDDDDA